MKTTNMLRWWRCHNMDYNVVININEHVKRIRRMTADHDVQNNKNSTYTWKDSRKTSPDERLVHRVCGDFWWSVASIADAALSRHVCSQRVETRLSAHTVQSSVGRRRWESHPTHSDGAKATDITWSISSTVCNSSLNVTQQHSPIFPRFRPHMEFTLIYLWQFRSFWVPSQITVVNWH